MCLNTEIKATSRSVPSGAISGHFVSLVGRRQMNGPHTTQLRPAAARSLAPPTDRSRRPHQRRQTDRRTDRRTNGRTAALSAIGTCPGRAPLGQILNICCLMMRHIDSPCCFACRNRETLNDETDNLSINDSAKKMQRTPCYIVQVQVQVFIDTLAAQRPNKLIKQEKVQNMYTTQ